MTLEPTNNLKQELSELIDQTTQDEEIKDLWSETITYLKDDEAQTLLDLLREDPTQLAFLTKNLQEKIEALKNNDEEAMKKITEEEEAYAEGL